jgi:hypothetical protein
MEPPSPPGGWLWSIDHPSFAAASSTASSFFQPRVQLGDNRVQLTGGQCPADPAGSSVISDRRVMLRMATIIFLVVHAVTIERVEDAPGGT